MKKIFILFTFLISFSLSQLSAAAGECMDFGMPTGEACVVDLDCEPNWGPTSTCEVLDTPPVANNVTINGTTTQGEDLNVTYTYFDADGDPQTGATFKWFRADDNSGTNQIQIAGATASTYTLVAQDVGKFIQVYVYPFNVKALGNGTESVYTVAIAANGADITAPTLTFIVHQTPSSSPTNADTLIFQAVFDEDVQNVSAADFNVTGTTATITNVTAVSNTTYNITVSGGDLAGLNASVFIALTNAQDITDTSANALTNLVATDSNSAYLVDNTPPTVTEDTAVVTPGDDTTPSYSINVGEASTTLNIGGSCGSPNEGLIGNGVNVITLTSPDNTTALADNTDYTDCTATVTDEAGNISSTLNITNFTVGIPVIPTPVPTLTPTPEPTPTPTPEPTPTPAPIVSTGNVSSNSQSTTTVDDDGNTVQVITTVTTQTSVTNTISHTANLITSLIAPTPITPSAPVAPAPVTYGPPAPSGGGSTPSAGSVKISMPITTDISQTCDNDSGITTCNYHLKVYYYDINGNTKSKTFTISEDITTAGATLRRPDTNLSKTSLQALLSVDDETISKIYAIYAKFNDNPSGRSYTRNTNEVISTGMDLSIFLDETKEVKQVSIYDDNTTAYNDTLSEGVFSSDSNVTMYQNDDGETIIEINTALDETLHF